MTDPLVSVIIPTYDRSDKLPRAVESVLDQTYGRFELIVVDDCSPTPVAETFNSNTLETDVEISVIRHERNKGANAARNTGIRAAGGELIAFLDDDDWWDPDKLAKQVTTFQTNGSRVGVVYTGTRIDNDDGSTTTRINDARGDITKAVLLGNPVGSFSVVMVRMAAIEESGFPDENLPNAQDREWYIRLSQNWDFEPVTEPLVNKRVSGQTVDRISFDLEARKDFSYPRIIEKHRSLAREYGILFERRMIAQLSFQIGYRAMRTRKFNTSRYYMLKAIVYYPLDWRYYVGFIGAIIGRPLLRLAEKLNSRWLNRFKQGYFSYFH